LIYYDPGARYFTEGITQFFFDRRGFTLAPGASAFYEIFLVIGFGIECLVLGFVVQWVLRRFRGSQSTPSMPTTAGG
jgi:hypothetical protein